MFSIITGALAFSGAGPAPAGRSAIQMMAKSKAVPFVEANPVIANLPASVGFDPLMLANAQTVGWMQEAELKHGRVCMLAVLGWVSVDLGFHFPLTSFGFETDTFAGVSSLAAHDVAVKTGDMFRLFLYVALAETLSFGKTIEMVMGGKKVPGDLGFDPLNFKGGESYAKLQVNEIKNGRLAMIAFSGIATQAAMTGHGFPYL